MLCRVAGHVQVMRSLNDCLLQWGLLEVFKLFVSFFLLESLDSAMS